MTPNIGQGANTAVEDAATLASLINKLVESGHSSDATNSEINNLFGVFQSSRYARVKRIYQQSCSGARLQTRDDVLKILIGRYIFPYITDYISHAMCKDIAGGHFIDFLPLPKRSKAGWTEYGRSNMSGFMRLPWGPLWLYPLIFSLFCVLCLRPWSSSLPILS